MTEITEEQARVYKKLMKSFFISLKEKNPNLKMSFLTSFDDLPEEYKEGKFVARANKQVGSPEFILQVSEDFDLPFEAYAAKDLTCTSWRNNGFNGGLPDEISESQKNQLPADFDVVIFQGEPQEENSFNAYSMSLYVVGGCAKPVELEKKSSFGR